MEYSRDQIYQRLPVSAPPTEMNPMGETRNRYLNLRSGDVSSEYLLGSTADVCDNGDGGSFTTMASSKAPKTTRVDETGYTTETATKMRQDQAQHFVHWKGLPWYRFLGDVLSVVLSICFISQFLRVRETRPMVYGNLMRVSQSSAYALFS